MPASASSVLGRQWDQNIVNRPLPLVAQGAKIAKETILESRERSAFQKIASPCREKESSPSGVKSFGFRIFPAEAKKYFLGVLRALSEAGGSFFKSILQPDESFSLVFDCPVLLGNHASRLCAVTSVIAGAGQAGTGARTRACISPP
jgi:hypothetical protein